MTGSPQEGLGQASSLREVIRVFLYQVSPIINPLKFLFFDVLYVLLFAFFWWINVGLEYFQGG